MEAATAPPAPADNRSISRIAQDEADAIDAAEERGDVEGPPAPSSAPDPVTPDSSRDDGLRRYVVLEQQDLAELVEGLFAGKGVELDDDDRAVLEGIEVLLNLGTYGSKNTEHALRQAAKQAYDSVEHAEPTLIPVSETYWRPTKLTVKNERTVTFG